MGKALVTSGVINDGLKEQIIRMVEDAVRKGIPVIGLTDESGKRVARRGPELISRTLDTIRELSLELPEMPCFGVADWQKLYGITLTPKQIEAVSQFPWSEKTLNAPCPFHPGKMVRETHFAFVGLDTVSIMELQKLNPSSSEPRFYDYAPNSWYSNEKFAKETLKLRWYLLLKDIVPNSENKTFDEQKAMLPKEYEVPSAVAETAKDFLHYKKTKSYVNSNRWARTADLDSDRYRVDVGYCDARGVVVGSWLGGSRRDYVGVSASRKFE